MDNNSVEILTFENGALGTVTTSWTHYGEECNASSLYCERLRSSSTTIRAIRCR
ncbi:MAG: hypothetical protein R2912_00080 [Eubacteriales bacterium]